MTPCWWREFSPKGGEPATPWSRGHLFNIVHVGNGFRAMVVTLSGSVLPCEMTNILVAATPALQTRWGERIGPY